VSGPAVTKGYVEWCDRLYWRSRDRIAPGLQNSQYGYAACLTRALSSASRWLDLGCGHEFLPSWFTADERRLDLEGRLSVGLDQDELALRRHRGVTYPIRGNGEQLPFRSGSFDLVTANTVLEHVRQPLVLFREVHRVLRPNGRFLVHTPNARGYTTLVTRLIPHRLRAPLAGVLHRREAADVYRTYYRANTIGALRQLALQSELAVEKLMPLNSSPQLVLLPPLLLLELSLLRALSRPGLAALRPSLIALFQKI